MPDLRQRLMLGAAVGLWFWAVYAGANAYAASLTGLPDARIALDAAIPFRPGWAWVYMTVSPMLMLPLVVLPLPNLTALAKALAAQIALAGLAYILFPVAPSAHPLGDLPAIFRLADTVNLTYNSAPSLHVALSVTCALAMTRRDRPLRSAALLLWAAAITASALLTHQHYLIDVATGLLLAALGLALYSRWRVKNAAMSRRISGI